MRWLVGCFCIWCFLPGALSAITLEQVQDRYLSVQSFHGEFLQTTVVEAENREAQAKGTIVYERPGKMRWEYLEPDPQLLVTDGATLWLYDPLLENVTVQELAAVTDGTALSFLLGVGELTEDFSQRRLTQSRLPPEREWEVLELVPNRLDSTIQYLQIGVDPQTGDLQALLFLDNSGSLRMIEMKSLRYDEDLNPELFTFDIPPGMEVIRP